MFLVHDIPKKGWNCSDVACPPLLTLLLLLVRYLVQLSVFSIPVAFRFRLPDSAYTVSTNVWVGLCSSKVSNRL